MNKPATGMEERNSFFGGNPFFEGHTGLVRIGWQKWHDLGRSPFRFEARSLMWHTAEAVCTMMLHCEIIRKRNVRYERHGY